MVRKRIVNDDMKQTGKFCE